MVLEDKHMKEEMRRKIKARRCRKFPRSSKISSSSSNSRSCLLFSSVCIIYLFASHSKETSESDAMNVVRRLLPDCSQNDVKLDNLRSLLLKSFSQTNKHVKMH